VGGPLPSKAVTDALLDGLGEVTERAITRHGNLTNPDVANPASV
jgi:hypothetical protein